MIPDPAGRDAINEEVRREVEEIHVNLVDEGIFIKADSIGGP